MSAFTELDQRILDFERQWFQFPGARDQAIRETFDMTPTRYAQRLLTVLSKPQALEYDAQLVRRLQRRVRARRVA